MFKKICSLGLLSCIVMGSFPVYAEEVTKQPVQIDKWARGELYNAEVSGIVPAKYHEVLSQNITSGQLNEIVTGLKKQMIQAGLTQKEAVTVNSASTREEVLNAYYNILKGYEGTIDLKADAMTYMQQAGVIKGDEKGNLNLDKACTVQDAIIFANRVVVDIYKQTGTGTKGFLWEVSDENNKVYLLGTVHVGKAELYPFSDNLNKAIEESDNVSFEIDLNDQEGLTYLMQKQMYLDGTTLKDHVDEETYKRAVDVFAKYGLTEEQTQVYKPWALSNSLTVLSAQNTGDVAQAVAYPAVDVYVYSKALLEEKEILEIEGYVFQADLLDGIDDDYQVASLKAGLDMAEGKNAAGQEATDKAEVTDEAELINQWLTQFMARDIDGFKKSYDKTAMLESGDLMAKALFEGRDDHMTAKVVEYLNDKDNDTYFVAVGAGHMIGEKGIVKQLQDQGYTVNVVPVK